MSSYLTNVVLDDIQGINGSTGDDHIIGTNYDDIIEGKAGDDWLQGGAGADVFAYSGTSAGFDVVDGGSGNDIVRAASPNTVIGITSVYNVEAISGGGNSGVYISGNDANNFLDFWNVSLFGITRIDGGGGEDTIRASTYNTVAIYGGAGNDLLLAESLSETSVVLNGDDGDDTLIGGAGSDVLNGGDGFDTAVFAGIQAEYDLSLPGIVVHIATGASDALSGIDQLLFDDGALVINTAPGAVSDADAAPNQVSENAVTGDTVGISALSFDPDDGSAAFGAAAFSVAGDAADGDTPGIAALSMTSGGGSITYRLVDDAGGRFAIDADTGVVTVANAALLDYEAAGSHSIVIAASDGSLSTTATMSIALLDGNDAPLAPADTDGAANSVAENAATGTAVGITATSSDPNGPATITFSLLDNAGGRFAIDAATGVVTVANGGLLDYETATSHTITVRASDNGTPIQSSQQTFTIAVVNGAEMQAYSGTEGNDAFTAATAELWTIEGFDGNDTLTGNTLADTLYGGAGDDVLNGGGGDDVFLVAGAGDGFDAVTGGIGNDVIRAADDGTEIGLKSIASVEAISADGHAGVSIKGDGAANTLNFSAVTLTGIDLIDGGAGNDAITGSAGADAILGNVGNDALIGGAGDDTLDGGVGSDALTGGTGNDTYLVDVSTDTVTEAVGAGTDTVRTTAAAYTLSANVEVLAYDGVGSFTGIGNATANLITGGEGNDTLTGGAGADTLDGGSDGLDTASYTTAVSINLTTGVHTGDALGDQFIGIEVIAGSAGADSFTGDDGDNIFLAGAGNDTLNGAAGGDMLDGGAGIDTASYATSAAEVVVNLATGEVGGGDADWDTLIGIENVTGSAYADVLTGDAGANALIGGAGDDTLDGGAGTDALTGGAGNDTYVVDVTTDVVTEAVGAGTDTVRTTLAAYTLGANVEVLAYDGAGTFTGTGNTLANLITGGEGNDTLIGGAGADTLDGGEGIDTASYAAAVTINLATGVHTGDALGDQFFNIEIIAGSAVVDSLTGDDADNIFLAGAGNDTLNGGAGGDLLDGGAGIDTASYATSAAGVVVNLGTGEVWGGEADGDLLVGIENVTGSADADALTGNAGANALIGGAGDDTLDGGAGTDALTGGAGNLTAGTSDHGDVLIGIEYLQGSTDADALIGNASANALIGNAGDDWLEGGAGNDTLTGGAGRDEMRGDAGLDRFVFALDTDTGIDGAADLILDFTSGQDILDLGGIDANAIAAGNQAFSFIGAANFTNVSGQLRYAQTGDGYTHVYGDRNGDGTSDLQIVVTGTLTMAAANFVL